VTRDDPTGPTGAYPPQGCLFPLQIGKPMVPYNNGWQPTQMGWLDAFWGPSYEVGRLDWSEFRFLPNTMYHRLFVRRRGYGNGPGNCVMWIQGSYVLGTYQECFYYALPWPGPYRP
jgi:hypothetical protein